MKLLLSLFASKTERDYDQYEDKGSKQDYAHNDSDKYGQAYTCFGAGLGIPDYCA